MEAGQYTTRGIYVGAIRNTRLFELDTPVVSTLGEARLNGIISVMGHEFANRIHVVKGVVDPYNGVVYAEIVEEIDIQC